MHTMGFDVVVAGGGTAGAIAAIAAARNGARTCLVEAMGHLGGTCHALANVTPFHNSRGEQVVGGLAQELVDRVVAMGGGRERGHLPNPAGIGGSFTPLDPDVMKLALFELADEAGVELWLHTTLVAVLHDAGRVNGVRVHNKSGSQDLLARIVIDATGDADVVMRAGGEYTQDTPEAALNATLLFRAGGVDTDAFIADTKRSPHKVVLLADPYLRDVKKLTPQLVMAGVRDIYDCPYIYLSNVVRDYVPRADWSEWEITGEDKSGWGRLQPFAARFSIMPLPQRRDVVTLNVTSITFDATDGAQRSRAELTGQRQMRMALEVLRRYVPGFGASFLHTVLPAVSIRASRRIAGAYELTRADVEGGARFDDAIARGSYPMSVQSATRPGVREHLFVRDGGDYDIPYRCLVPRRLDAVLVAGRCLSATREAIGSARMGAQCMAYGQAAGTAAALAIASGTSARDLDMFLLRDRLRAQHAIL